MVCDIVIQVDFVGTALPLNSMGRDVAASMEPPEVATDLALLQFMVEVVSNFVGVAPPHPGLPYAGAFEGKRVSNPPSQGAEPVLKCGYGSSDERSPDKTTTDTGRDSADCGGVCN